MADSTNVGKRKIRRSNVVVGSKEQAMVDLLSLSLKLSLIWSFNGEGMNILIIMLEV